MTAVRPVPGSKTRDRTTAVGATVRDDRSELQKGDIRLYVDGQEHATFSYDAAQDRLRYTSSPLSTARHTVKIVATDVAGNSGAKSWRFTAVH